ncbi:unnamed protein product [Menidia menidia]|uniref:(Atlantic silverside) hypothetical protein n=1 Tax=Menidia menidia TaxID=238744 RepID=A0A8S4BAD4_9TELE|nr:unnamed protein product [Menidia menidia]
MLRLGPMSMVKMVRQQRAEEPSILCSTWSVEVVMLTLALCRHFEDFHMSQHCSVITLRCQLGTCSPAHKPVTDISITTDVCRKNRERGRDGESHTTSFLVYFLCFATDAGNQFAAQEAVRKPSMLRRPPARTGETISNCLNCSQITALSEKMNSLEAKVQLLTAPTSVSHRHLQSKGGTSVEASLLMGAAPAQGAPGEQGPAGIKQVLGVRKGEMGFLAGMVGQGLEGCQVHLGPAGMLVQGVHLEPLDRRDPKDLQARVDHRDSQERKVYQARPGPQGLQAPHLQPVPTSQNQTTIVEKTLSSATLSMTQEVYLFQDLRVLPGLLGHQVPEDPRDLLAPKGRMANLEVPEHRARWGQRENAGREVLWVTQERGASEGSREHQVPKEIRERRACRLMLRHCLLDPKADISLQMFHDLQADLELLARRVTLLEAIIWPEPDLGSGDGPFGTASPSFYRDKRAGVLPHRLASPLSSNTKTRGK